MIIAFTGAGISKASGIDTFMDQPTVRDRLTRNFATNYPQQYRELIADLSETAKQAAPNDAHYALYDYNIPVITMNVDMLHERAGSETISLHGTLPTQEEYAFAEQLHNKPVLYGDSAPKYYQAMDLVNRLKEQDTLLVIGASTHTGIAVDIRQIAKENGADVIEVQANAEIEVRKILERLHKK